MVDYAMIASGALDKIRAYGLAMTLTKPTAGTFAPGTGTFSGCSTTASTVYGLLRAPNLSERGDRWYDGTLIQAGDRFVTLAASGMTTAPAPGDTLTVSGTGWTVVACMPISPGGTDLLYRALLRK